MNIRLLAMTGTALAVLAGGAAGVLPIAPAAQAQQVDFIDDYRAWNLSEYEAQTGRTVPDFTEAPQLAAAVAAGTLPPLAERLPERDDIMVVQPRESIGRFGGTIRYNATNPQTFGNMGFTSRDVHLAGFTTNWEEVFPDIARSIELAPDHLSATVTLRRGMRWSDGAPVTADDIMFFVDEIAGHPDLPPMPAPLIVGGEPVAVERIDDHTVVFSFTTPNPAFILSVARNEAGFPLAPRHYLSRWHIDHNPEADALAASEGFSSWVDAFLARQAGQTQNFQVDPNLPVLRPFVMREIDQFGNIYYERNPFYWKVDTEGQQLPYIDEMVRMLISDPEVVKLNLQGGRLDFADKFVSTDLPVLRAGEAAGNYTTLLLAGDHGAVIKYQFHITIDDPVLQPIFQDIRFRQAMSLAINRDEINDAAFFGLGIPRQWGVSSLSPFFEEWMADHYAAFDPEAANALLDEMGLAMGPNGIRLRPDGQELRIVLFDAINRVQVSELVAEYWSNVGVATQVNTLTREAFQQSVLARSKQASVWFGDVVSEMDMFTRPIWFRPPYGLDTNPLGGGIEWRRWELTNGAEGTEPPAEFRAQQELVARWQATVLGSDEYYELGREVVANTVRKMLHIGTVGEVPNIYARSNRLQNFPGEGKMIIDHMRGAHADQWWLSD